MIFGATATATETIIVIILLLIFQLEPSQELTNQQGIRRGTLPPSRQLGTTVLVIIGFVHVIGRCGIQTAHAAAATHDGLSGRAS